MARPLTASTRTASAGLPQRLTVADADFAHGASRHVDVAPEKFIGAARALAENTARVLGTVARWQGVSLSEPAQLEFARRAAAPRWDAEEPIARALSPAALFFESRSPGLRDSRGRQRLGR